MFQPQDPKKEEEVTEGTSKILNMEEFCTDFREKLR